MGLAMVHHIMDRWLELSCEEQEPLNFCMTFQAKRDVEIRTLSFIFAKQKKNRYGISFAFILIYPSCIFEKTQYNQILILKDFY